MTRMLWATATMLLLVPAPLDQPAVLGREVGVAFEDGAARTLHEGLAQDAVGETGAAPQPLARHSRGCPGRGPPRTRHGRRSEARHVAAEFGDDCLGGAPRDTGNRVESGERVGVCRSERLDAAIIRRDGVVEKLDVAQEVFEHEAVMGGDARVSVSARAGRLRRRLRLASSASSSGVPAPAIRALSIAHADTPAHWSRRSRA